ncbi:hypothetical protein TSMEX_008260, partial [Taenia solium]
VTIHRNLFDASILLADIRQTDCKGVVSQYSFEDGSAGRRNVFAYIHSPTLEIVLPLGLSFGPGR